MDKEILDNTNKKILHYLDANSRQTSTQIAKKLRINKNTANFRINRLIKEEYLLGFYPSIDLSRLGFISFRVYCKFFNTNKEIEREILDFLTQNKDVAVLAELELTYDLMFMVTVKSINDFWKFWEDFKTKYRQYLWNEQISIVNKIAHFKRDYLFNSKEKYDEEIVGGNQEIKIDEQDAKILSLMAKNCRMSALEISDKTKISPRTVLFKIKQLEKKKIILGYRANINLSKIGYSYYKLNFKLNNLSQIKKMILFAKEHPNIIFVDFMINNFDFEMDAEVKNKDELIAIINDFKQEFNCIRDYELIIFKKYYKIETIPSLF